MENICENFTIPINETTSVLWADLVEKVIILALHIPTVIIRVQKWETVQLWCLLCTLLTVAVYVQAYVSTKFSPETILLWTPLLLLIDAGSMAQIFFLVNDDNYLLIRVRCLWIQFKHMLYRTNPKKAAEDIQVLVTREEQRREVQAARHPRPQQRARTLSKARLVPLYKDQSFYIAAAALFLFLFVFVLQVIGLKKAVDGLKVDVLQVRWCSPIFQPFGLIVRDGNCNVYPIIQSSSKGIGCINLSGYEQKQWLHGTVAGTSISIVLEFIDLAILVFVGASSKSRGVKMRRPWCTMFSGLAVLGVTLIFGVIYASNLPNGITQIIWVVVNIDEPRIYRGFMLSPGLRGPLIGWNDGLFASWGPVYYGN